MTVEEVIEQESLMLGRACNLMRAHSELVRDLRGRRARVVVRRLRRFFCDAGSASLGRLPRRCRKVIVAYTTTVDDYYRRAINHHYGQPGLASREEVRRWLETHGTSADDDLIWDLQADPRLN